MNRKSSVSSTGSTPSQLYSPRQKRISRSAEIPVPRTSQTKELDTVFEKPRSPLTKRSIANTIIEIKSIEDADNFIQFVIQNTEGINSVKKLTVCDINPKNEKKMEELLNLQLPELKEICINNIHHNTSMEIETLCNVRKLSIHKLSHNAQLTIKAFPNLTTLIVDHLSIYGDLKLPKLKNVVELSFTTTNNTFTKKFVLHTRGALLDNK